MILFENGVCHGGETAGIIEPDFDEYSGDDLYLNPLLDGCWFLTINDGGASIDLKTGDEVDFDFVPTELEIASDNYEFFYGSNLTALFVSYEEAMDFLDHYHGPFEREVLQFYQNQLKQLNHAGYIQT